MAVSMKLTSQNPNHYDTEVNTQSEGKTIYICQNCNGIHFSIKSAGNVDRHVPREMIEGLPKGTIIPREFFEQCHATLTQNSVKFIGKLKGGMYCCAPASPDKHDFSVTQKDTTSLSAGIGAGISAGRFGKAEANTSCERSRETSTTRYYSDCKDKDCPSSGANPNNQPNNQSGANSKKEREVSRAPCTRV